MNPAKAKKTIPRCNRSRIKLIRPTILPLILNFVKGRLLVLAQFFAPLSLSSLAYGISAYSFKFKLVNSPPLGSTY